MAIRIPPTDEQNVIAHAAARDAGNRAMKKGGRTAWSKEDYLEAVRVYNELMTPKEI